MNTYIDYIDNFDEFIEFNENSEKESMEISGISCKDELIRADAKLRFNIYENGVIVTQGVVTDDDELIWFTSSDKHSYRYIALIFELVSEYNHNLTTYTSSWYYKSRVFLKKLGFYLADDYGKVEKWVLEKK